MINKMTKPVQGPYKLGGFDPNEPCYRYIDAPEHYQFARVTWKMDGDDFNLGCEHTAILLTASWDMMKALQVIANCVADDKGGVTLGTYEMALVRGALAKAGQ